MLVCLCVCVCVCVCVSVQFLCACLYLDCSVCLSENIECRCQHRIPKHRKSMTYASQMFKRWALRASRGHVYSQVAPRSRQDGSRTPRIILLLLPWRSLGRKRLPRGSFWGPLNIENGIQICPLPLDLRLSPLRNVFRQALEKT